MKRGEVGKEALDGQIHDARAGHTSTDHKGTANDDDEVVREAREGPLRRQKAKRDCRDESHAGHHVVAKLLPEEGSHHHRDEAEGKDLLVCHGAPATMRMFT